MKKYLKQLWEYLFYIYLGQLAVCLWYNETPSWHRWIEVEFHAIVWSVAVIAAGIMVYSKKIRKQ